MLVSDSPLERVQHLMELAAGPQRNFAATELYNEGWMLRLVLDWHEQHPGTDSPLALPKGRTARWYSEGRLPTPFRVEHRGTTLGEAQVRVNGIVGHLEVSETHADIRLAAKASHFVVIESKMGTGLVESSRFGGRYDQAARTVACMAKALQIAKLPPEKLGTLAFYLVAPEVRVKADVYGDLVSARSIGERVAARHATYRESVKEPAEVDTWFNEWFTPTLAAITLEVLTWEQLLHDVRAADSTFGEGLDTFYHQSLIHNRVHVRTRARGRRAEDG